MPGFTPAGIFQAVPTDYGPSLYSVQTSTDGTQTAIQAATADGQVLWETTLPWPYGGTSVPDGFGGLLLIGACNANASPAISLSITDLDPVTGGARWGMQFPTVYNGTPMCVTGTPKMAIRQDGAVVVSMPLQTSPALMVLDGQSGGELPITPAIPPSTMTGTQGDPLSCDCLTPVGQPIVDSDGSVYVEYDVEETQLANGQLTWNFSLPAASTSSILSLLKIAPDGSTTTTQLSSATSVALMPGNVIPDGQGGVLATWAVINVPTLANNWNAPIAQQPYQAADVSAGTVLNTYALPNAPQGQQIPSGSDGLPIQASLVLGENGTAIASYPSTGPFPPTVTSFNLNAGSANWVYQQPVQAGNASLALARKNASSSASARTSNPALILGQSDDSSNSQENTSIAAALSDNSVVLQDSLLGLIPISSGGSVGTAIPGLLEGSPWSLGFWLGLNAAGMPSLMAGPAGSLALPWSTENGGLPGSKSTASVNVVDIIPTDDIDPATGRLELGFPSAEDAQEYITKQVSQANFGVSLLTTSAVIPYFTSAVGNAKVTAVGYIGHSDITDPCTSHNPPIKPACGPEYSTGIRLFNGLNPLDPNYTVYYTAPPSMGSAQYPVLAACANNGNIFPCYTYAEQAPANGIQTPARVVFIGACDIGPVFENLWNMSSNTTAQAFIVPITSDTQVILGHAIWEWEEILELMIARETAYNAVQNANTFCISDPLISKTSQLRNTGKSTMQEPTMSRYIRSITFLLLFVCVLLFVGAPVLAQTSIPVKQETILTFAHDLLQVFYPEFLNKDHRLSLCIVAPGDFPWVEIGGAYFAVTSANVNPLDKLISPRPVMTDPIILGGSIWLPPMEYGRVQELRAYGDAVHGQQLENLRRLVASHSDWTETQITSALKQAGARFAPSDQEAFVNSLPLNKAERFLGRLKITSTEFEYPKRDQSGHLTASGLDWVVRADAELADGTHPQYVFTFEPFEGKLTDLAQSLHR